METTFRAISIFTDGACHPNPGRGGWAAILRDETTGVEKHLQGDSRHTTNNRMELRAALHALEALTSTCRVNLVSDSQYVIKGLNEWRHGWARKNWGGVKNADLWKRFHEVANKHKIKGHWIKGHAGHRENEQCDRMADAAAKKAMGGPDTEEFPGPDLVEVVRVVNPAPKAAAHHSPKAHSPKKFGKRALRASDGALKAHAKKGNWGAVLRELDAQTPGDLRGRLR